ncbi:synaptic vesicle 2-related protein-like [Saccoglossus kowalevskii]|uniref:Synaptic vesicle 2-related protein-like n=1 Tax=Saccoglossus kowalevskii TaxID=10224 RepID=A0ABM0MD22_SACKO|nr:PREDICTED: synaptic vesicle 2-related protein-like [Saccoglossus kowalevskii]
MVDSSKSSEFLVGVAQEPFVKFRRFRDEEVSPYEHLGGDDHVEIGDSSRDEEIRKRVVETLDEDTFTVEDAVEAIGFGKFQIKLSLLAGLCWMADAMEMMILSILSPELHCIWKLKSWQEALITTVVFIGMFMSSTIWGSICDKYGRRVGLIMCSIWLFYYGVLTAFSPTLLWMLLLRGLVGFGIGGVPQSVTLYAEFLPSTARARCVVFIEVFWAIGTCFEVALALVVMPTLGWRWLLAFSAIPVLIFAVSCWWLPESARYQVACGKQEAAFATLKRIALENNKPMPLGKLVIRDKTEKRGKFSDLFVPQLRMTTIVLMFIWFANAFSYYGIVLMTTELFQSGSSCPATNAANTAGSPEICYTDCRGLSTKDYVDLLWTSIAEFPGLVITFFIIEWIGRKKTMAVEFLVFSLFTFLICICTTRTVLTIFLFIARAFISGAFQAAYVYTPEVYPTTVRAIGLGACSGMARVGALLTPFVAQVMLRISEYLAISIYGSVCILAAIASMMLPIETKGRAMHETHSDSRKSGAEEGAPNN